MDYSQTVKQLDAATIAKLTTAIELGRWESGDKLTESQRESAMQAVMMWQAQNQENPDNQPFVVGANGELYTGKGQSHKVAQPPKFDDQNVIIKKKV